jgi:hypothetical protein
MDMADFLRDRGYCVYEAATAQEAIDKRLSMTP